MPCFLFEYIEKVFSIPYNRKSLGGDVMKKHCYIVGTLALILLDQGLKLLIHTFYLDARFPLFPPFLYFHPYQNTDFSWINNLFNFGIGQTMHILLTIVIIVAIYFFYRMVAKEISITPLINTAFAFCYGGAFCSLIDRVCWGGSLDFIQLKGFFIFDFKDIYINVFIILLLLSYALQSLKKRKAEQGMCA